MNTRQVRIGADVGGTFTDVILQSGSGEVRIKKVLSTPPAYDVAVVNAIRELVDEDRETVDEVVHGTTVATNAVLEKLGARTAIVTTLGFRDVFELRRMRMPHLYDYFWEKPAPLVPRHLRFEVEERMSASGEVLERLTRDEALRVAEELGAMGVESVAVCLLHAHLYPEHEELLRAVLRSELPDIPISLSSEILREQQEYERTATTVVNAYIQPLMAGYVDKIREGVSEFATSAPLMIMQSSGGVMTADDAATRPVYALESGPAAGVVAALGLADALGYSNVITFDMGGTTAKASLIENGRVSRSQEYEVGASLSAGSRLLRGSGELIRIQRSTSPRLAPAEGVSRGSTRRVRFRSAREALVRCLGQPAMDVAGTSPPLPTRTCCSVTSRPVLSHPVISSCPPSLPSVLSNGSPFPSACPYARRRGASTGSQMRP